MGTPPTTMYASPMVSTWETPHTHSQDSKTNFQMIVTITCVCVPVSKTYLVNIVHSREPVESEVHGVQHEDNLDGLTQGADVSERHHVTEQYGALFKFS